MLFSKKNLIIVIITIIIAVEDIYAGSISTDDEVTAKCKEGSTNYQCVKKAFKSMLLDEIQCPYTRNYFMYLRKKVLIDKVKTPLEFCYNMAKEHPYNSSIGVQCFAELRLNGFHQIDANGAFEHAFYHTTEKIAKQNFWAHQYFMNILQNLTIPSGLLHGTNWCSAFARSMEIITGPNHAVQVPNHYGLDLNLYVGRPSHAMQDPSGHTGSSSHVAYDLSNYGQDLSLYTGSSNDDVEDPSNYGQYLSL